MPLRQGRRAPHSLDNPRGPRSRSSRESGSPRFGATKRDEKTPRCPLQPRTQSKTRVARHEDHEALADPFAKQCSDFRSPLSGEPRASARGMPHHTAPLRERLADDPRRVLLMKTPEFRVCLVERERVPGASFEGVSMAPAGPPIAMGITPPAASPSTARRSEWVPAHDFQRSELLAQSLAPLPSKAARFPMP